MAKRKPHNMQQIVVSENKTIRFRENKIVSFLLDLARNHGVGLNEIALMNFSKDDQAQFAQLIGYSVSGWGDLSYVPKKQLIRADRKAAELWYKINKEK